MKAGGALVTAVRGLVLTIMTLAGSITLFVLSLVSIALIPTGVGLFTTPLVIDLVRAHADNRRRLAHEWGQVSIARPYRPVPEGLRGGLPGVVKRCFLLLRDPATWRDLMWLSVDMTAGCLLAILPPALLLDGVFGYVLAAGVWRPIYDTGSGYWYSFIQIESQTSAFLAAGLGTVYIAIALTAGRAIQRGHFFLTRAFLAPTPQMSLAARVERLTATRHDALDTSAAELRRIERDLHDGAQARLVAMGMSLGTIEALIEKDPAKAKELLAAARTSSAEALAELRDLVRGIHPPVLAERGLGDAVRALTLRMEMPVMVDVEIPGRVEEPVEAAAYFAISEALTNAAKHSGADQVWVDVHYAEGALRMAVTDDGRGGAALSAGSGLRGVERRLGAFDGVLAVSSPPGGPTMVTMEVPCEPAIREGRR
ncbi:sensor histidine kinase [Streptomyces sp. NPDC018031]|uniref:sensor histidine kinase n=1 Tax=Streptomyces sp. NPDC018031 TaxID=3365033 RepID=UPI003797A195